MKLNKKLTSILVTGAMIASIGGTTAMTSFAEEPANLSKTGQVAAITKILETPAGTNIGDGWTFKFNIKPIADYGSNADLDSSDAIQRTIKIDSTSAVSKSSNDETTKYVAASEALFNEGDFVFPHAGRYAFEVTEVNENAKDVTYDVNTYKIFVDVANSKTDDGKYVVKNIVAQDDNTKEKEDPNDPTKTVIDESTKVNVGNYTDKDGDNAVDQFEEDNGTPADAEDKNTADDILTNMEANGVDFDNIYVESTDVTPDGKEDDKDTPDDETDNDATGLYVQKNVDGDLADKTQVFKFDVKVKAPELAQKLAGKTAITYNAKVVEVGTGTVVKAYTFTSGAEEATVVELKDNQRLVFTDLDIGADVDVAEQAAANYQAFLNDEAKGDMGAEATIVKGLNVKNDKDNGVRVVNKYDDEGTTPTGILMQNAPYILVATLAAGGLVIYLAKRREEEEEA